MREAKRAGMMAAATAVCGAIKAGAGSLGKIRTITGLETEVVHAAIRLHNKNSAPRNKIQRHHKFYSIER